MITNNVSYRNTNSESGRQINGHRQTDRQTDRQAYLLQAEQQCTSVCQPAGGALWFYWAAFSPHHCWGAPSARHNPTHTHTHTHTQSLSITTVTDGHSSRRPECLDGWCLCTTDYWVCVTVCYSVCVCVTHTSHTLTNKFCWQSHTVRTCPPYRDES